MKTNINLLILFSMFLAITISVNADSSLRCGINPHDSLLFDGGNNIRTETFFSRFENDCEFRVTYVKGSATGKIKKMRIFEVCGDRIDTVYEYENGALEKYSVIKGGEQVITGPESSALIELGDGSQILLGPNTNYTLPENACDQVRKGFLGSGSLWTKIKKLVGGGHFEVSTERACACVRGTEFTVEIIEENGIKYDVVKVYEGSVEVSLKSLDTKNYEDKAEEFARLTEDWQAGKITLEEYSAIAAEYTQTMQNESSKMKLSEMVGSGFSLKTDGKSLGEVQQFNTSEDNWFKVNEYKK